MSNPTLAPALPCQEGLSERLRTATATLHARAERTGIVAEIMRGRVTRAGYARYLRNLLPAYAALEDGLRRHREPPIGGFARPELEREGAIMRDLTAIAGPDWPTRLALVPAAERYAEAVVQAGGPGLIGHAYARYLGDLSGAQFLRRALERSAGLGPAEQTFFEFPAIGDFAAYKTGYRAALDAAAAELPDPAIVIDAALAAFAHNIAVSEAVLAAG